MKLKDLFLFLMLSFLFLLYQNFTSNDSVSITALGSGAFKEDGVKSHSFRIQRSTSSGSALAVSFHISGSAKLNRDYKISSPDSVIKGTYPNYRVAIPALKNSVDIQLVGLKDDLVEGNEVVNFTIILSSLNPYEVGQPAAANHAIEDSAVEGNFDIILVAGQSNAQGAGAPYQNFVDSWAGSHIDSKIKQIGRGSAGNMQVVPVGNTIGARTWDGLLHWSRDRKVRKYMGFSLSFARGYVRTQLAPGRKVLIVPAACGATRLADWLPGGIAVSVDCPGADIYQDMKNRLNSALAKPGSNRIVAFLWHQGEADIRNIAKGRLTVNTYGNQLTGFFDQVRRDFPGNYPVLMGKYSPQWKVYNDLALEAYKLDLESMLGVIASQNSPIEIVSSNYLTTKDDNIHFDAVSQIRFGRRYFKKYKEFLAK